jgi:hypothetical protein
MTTERNMHLENTLDQLGFTALEAAALRRTSNALHRWALREYSGEIERDADGTPYVYVVGSAGVRRKHASIRDQEASAIARINEVLAARNARSAHESALSWYHHRDPRGRAVYILRPGDVPEGAPAHAHYNRGIAVY